MYEILIGIGIFVGQQNPALSSYVNDSTQYALPVRSLFDRMTVKPTYANKWQIERKYDTLYSDGIWQRLSDLIVFYGTDTSQQMVNWISSKYKPVTIGNTYFYSGGGVSEHYVNGYINTNYNPFLDANFHQDSAFVGVWYLTNYRSAGLQFGANDSHYLCLYGFGNNQMRPSINDGGSVFTYTPSIGMMSFSRNSHTTVNGYLNNTNLGTQTTTATGVPNQKVYLLNENSNGTLNGTSFDAIGLYVMGNKLTATQQAQFYSLFQNYFNATGVKNFTDVYSAPNFIYKKTVLQNNPCFNILYQYKNYGVGMYYDSIYYTANNWTTSRAMYTGWTSNLQYPSFAYIWNNGNLMICTAKNHVYTSQDGLSTLNEITPQHWGGTPYIFPTPVNPAYPGEYFFNDCPQDKIIDRGHEILIWGSYSNAVGHGPSAPVVWCSIDSGKTLKAMFEFGMDTCYTDDGTASGTWSTGHHLGRVDTSIVCRHIHQVVYDPNTNKFWISTGDFMRNATLCSPQQDEVWLFSNTLNWTTKSWTYEIDKYNWNTNHLFKTSGLEFFADSVIIGSDNNLSGGADTTQNNRGIWKAKISEMSDITKYRRVYPYNLQSCLSNYGDTVYAFEETNMGAVYSTNRGITWKYTAFSQVTSSYPAGMPCRLLPCNSNGYHAFASQFFTYNTFGHDFTFWCKDTVSRVAPAISSFTPTSGSTGDTITISGVNLNTVTSVKFNGTSASGIRIVNSSTLKAAVGTGTSGNIVVSSSRGISGLGGFTYTSGAAPAITVQPSNATVNQGSNTSFAVTATGTSLTYQWQYSTDNSTFSNLSNSGIYSNTTTATANLTGTTTDKNNYYYRVIVSGNIAPPATSSSVTLTVWDTNAVKYFTAISALHTPTATQKKAVNEFVIDLKNINVYQAGFVNFTNLSASALKGSYPILGNDSLCDKYNLLSPYNADSSFRIQNVGNQNNISHSTLYGLAYFNATWGSIPFVSGGAYQNDFSFAYYQTTADNAGDHASFGTSDSYVDFWGADVGTTLYYSVNSVTKISHSNASGQGLWMGIRKTSTYCTLYHNAATFDSTASTSANSSVKLELGRGYWFGTPYYLDDYIMYYGFGKSPASWTVAYRYMQAINKMETTLGRNKY